MLYNSYAFVLVFLPLTLLLHFGLFARFGSRWGLGWLAACSLAFYAYWRPPYVLLIVASMLVNYGFGRWLSAAGEGAHRASWRRPIATAAVALNLALLGYFKYLHFFSEAAGAIFPIHQVVAQAVLPLGISFFTFEQVGYIVDAYRGHARAYTFVEYVFFVTFFPHLIAGPIIVHSDLLGQVQDPGRYRARADSLACGATLFVIGLAKKVLVADTLAAFAAEPFARAAAGTTPPCISAWVALLAYALQLYFDFSGYSDMGLGLARMLNFKLPLNFDSPYKAHNIIEFWRRWHMTLSRFLREMLYIPLGGNRHGSARRHLNLAATMVLGGLWHGAGWNFLIWGGLHGLYLVVNHSWVAWRGRHLAAVRVGPTAAWALRQLSILVTFSAVLLGWVFFRATSLAAAGAMLAGLGGRAGVADPAGAGGMAWPMAACLAAYAAARVLPNSQELLAPHEPALTAIRTTWRRPWQWQPRWAAAAAVLAASSMLGFTRVSEFLYFQF